MINFVCSIPADQRVLVNKIILAVGIASWQALEAWLGKTDKVKAGSTPELLLSLVQKLWQKKGTDNGKSV